MQEEETTQTVVRAHRREVMRYWERRRWLYLALLAATTLAIVLPYGLNGWRGRDPSEVRWGLVTAALAFYFVAANLCYSVVYVFEFLVMGTRLQAVFHTWRALLLLAGCLLGMLLAALYARDLFWLL